AWPPPLAPGPALAAALTLRPPPTRSRHRRALRVWDRGMPFPGPFPSLVPAFGGKSRGRSERFHDPYLLWGRMLRGVLGPTFLLLIFPWKISARTRDGRALSDAQVPGAEGIDGRTIPRELLLAQVPGLLRQPGVADRHNERLANVQALEPQIADVA